MQPFAPTRVQSDDIDAFRRVLGHYEVMIVTVLDAILDRYERHPDYHFIDTKLSMLTGSDFPEPADTGTDFMGRTAVFGWIQGRGLESLVGHARWLSRCRVLDDAEKANRLSRIKKMIAEVFDKMEAIRSKNDGRLFFTMTPEGEPFDMDETGRRRTITPADRPWNYSDLFYVKGMAASATFLGREEKTEEAKRRFRTILADIDKERFVSDQVSFDPKNPIEHNARRLSHGPRMIGIGGCALFAGLFPDEDEWFEWGEAFIRHLLERYTNRGQFAELKRYDYFEGIDGSAKPWRTEGRVHSDPGHALEFVGLASKLLLLLHDRDRKTDSQQSLLTECGSVLPELFVRNFSNGFNWEIGGIVKVFDLVSRTPVNDEMPWWNLPETMRAAAELLRLCPETELKDDILRALVACSNGFMTRFVNDDVHLMAYQTIDNEGNPVDSIPATPDADPGYHTGLSLIDMIDYIGRL